MGVVQARMGVAAWAAVAMLGIAGCQGGERVSRTIRPETVASWAAITDLQFTDTVTGTGPPVGYNSAVELHYEGWLYDPDAPDHRGYKFDSSRDKGRPFQFRVGSGIVIKGWDDGVQGMRVGGKRQIIVPARLGYGERGAGGGVIPGGAALVFELELLRLQ
jgi:FKBP-type peptidyl-prolyl cis-trans isomerase FkpA